MNSTPSKIEDEAIFSRRDGERTYLIEMLCIFGVISILMVSALVFAIMPNNLLESDSIAAIDHWARSNWPKLDHDAKVLDASTPGRGARYSVFLVYCAGVMIVFLGTTLPITWWAITKSSERLSYPQSSALWKIPIGLLVLLLWNVFETFSFGSNTSVSRAIIGSSTLWFWTALLWGAFGMTWGGVGIVVAKLWIHGLPENKYEYEQRGRQS